MRPRLAARSLALGLGVLLSASTTRTRADTVLDTGLTEPGFGWVGYDIYPEQSVGIAFSPAFDCTLDTVGVWAMSNDFDASGRKYTLKLVRDASTTSFTIPNVASSIESWTISTAAVGWTPVLDQANSLLHPLLSAGSVYWLVAESAEPAGLDPLWTQAGNETPYYSGVNNAFNPNGWEGGQSFGSSPGTVINATPVPEPAATIGLIVGAPLVASRRMRRKWRSPAR